MTDCPFLSISKTFVMHSRSEQGGHNNRHLLTY